jgi:hypothetical protein
MKHTSETIRKGVEEFEERFPQFIGSGAPFPIFKETPNREHIKSHLFASQKALLEAVIKDIEIMKNHNEMIEMRGAEYTRGFEKALTDLQESLAQLIKTL